MLDDFNIDLLKNELSDSINNFIHTLNPNFIYYLIYSYIQEFLKHLLYFDNIFSNSAPLEIESGNVKSTFSDNLSRFIFQNIFPQYYQQQNPIFQNRIG